MHKKILILVIAFILGATSAFAGEYIFRHIDIGSDPVSGDDMPIHIELPEDVYATRRELTEIIRGTPILSDALPQINENSSVAELADYSIDELIVEMPDHLISHNYLIHAMPNNGQLILYHTGHSAAVYEEMDRHYANIKRLLADGYDVIVMFMPLTGPNDTQPVLQTECCGPLKLFSHAQMVWLDRPILPFIEPVTVVLNYADTQSYENYYLIGFSGGGWTTTLYAALDPRIKGSIPVAATLPLSVKNREDVGDFEQIDPELYRCANYLDLYIMGAYGPGRWQLQIFNKFDACCFAGERYEMYEEAVKTHLTNMDAGEFSVFLDDSHNEHKISDVAITVILDKLRTDNQ